MKNEIKNIKKTKTKQKRYNKNENEKKKDRGRRIIKRDTKKRKILDKIRVEIVLFFVDAVYIFQFLS